MVNKKAISPLIATLLLIAFTVALGVMIMNFGKNIVDDYGDCKSIQVELDDAPGSVCYLQDTSELSFTIVNKGKTDVSSFTIKTTNLDEHGEDRVKEFNVPDSAIKASETVSKTYPYSKPSSLKLEFIPKILKKNQEEKCLAQAITIFTLENC